MALVVLSLAIMGAGNEVYADGNDVYPDMIMEDARGKR